MASRRVQFPPAKPTIPPKSEKTRVQMDMYNILSIPTSGVIILADIAGIAFQDYALFTWLVTHRQEDGYDDGPTNQEVDVMVGEGVATVSKLENNGPASIFLILQGAYTKKPLQNEATERLILLALIAERPQLVSKVLRIFPEVRDPILLTSVLQPYINHHLEQYEKNLPELQGHGIIQAIGTMAKARLMQNQILRDALRARYAMVSVMADPHVFGTSSLTDIEVLVSRVESIIAANRALYTPLLEAVARLKDNFIKVQGVVRTGAAITIDAIRRLRLVLGVMNASDTLFDRMTSGTTASPASVVTPKPAF